MTSPLDDFDRIEAELGIDMPRQSSNTVQQLEKTIFQI